MVKKVFWIERKEKDIVATGVPAAVVALRAGDTAEMIIEKLGTLRNRVVAKQ